MKVTRTPDNRRVLEFSSLELDAIIRCMKHALATQAGLVNTITGATHAEIEPIAAALDDAAANATASSEGSIVLSHKAFSIVTSWVFYVYLGRPACAHLMIAETGRASVGVVDGVLAFQEEEIARQGGVEKMLDVAQVLGMIVRKYQRD